MSRMAALAVGLILGVSFTSVASYAMDQRDRLTIRGHTQALNCDTDSDCETKYGWGTVDTIPYNGAKLVGIDCGPDKVVLWADEEDHFPRTGCARIEAWRTFRW